jgi:hypothetical protein
MANAALARSTLCLHSSREIDELSLGLQTGERPFASTVAMPAES